MDKKNVQQEIDRMYEDIPPFVGDEHRYAMCVHHRELVAEVLVNKGYGNIEQALTEFVEKVKFNLKERCVSVAGFDLEDVEIDGANVVQQIDETLKEFLKQ